jgi:prepilin-type N-terminal cleavage/methylation domain-containing protein/prepilin-type processing-associated H-X9-DG protein
VKRRRYSCALPRGFTIVELLIVISIIVVLAGILFPIIGRVRARAGLAMCASNLHQLHRATAIYASDNGSYLPPYTSYTRQDDPRIPLLFRTDYSSHLVNVLDPYTKSRTIWFCPADPFAQTDSRVMGVNHKNTSYRNGNFWYGPGGTADRTNSQLMLFTDLLWECFTPEEEDGVRYEAYYSHGERFNNVYFDGHTVSFARGHHDQCFNP